MKQSGIYKILNATNGKIYVGSASYLKNRWNVHKCRLRKGNHHNKHLQNAWNKDGEQSFSFHVIEVCDQGNLKDRESFWLKTLNPVDRSIGYNKCVDVRSRRGIKSGPLSEANKQAISAANRKPHNPNIKHNYRRFLTREHKRKISAAHRLRNC